MSCECPDNEKPAVFYEIEQLKAEIEEFIAEAKKDKKNDTVSAFHAQKASIFSKVDQIKNLAEAAKRIQKDDAVSALEAQKESIFSKVNQIKSFTEDAKQKINFLRQGRPGTTGKTAVNGNTGLAGAPANPTNSKCKCGRPGRKG